MFKIIERDNMIVNKLIKIIGEIFQCVNTLAIEVFYKLCLQESDVAVLAVGEIFMYKDEENNERSKPLMDHYHIIGNIIFIFNFLIFIN